LSSGMMAANLLPNWINQIARFNPVNWAVVAARAVVSAGSDWSVVGWRALLLAGLLLGAGAGSTPAFRVYQRSVGLTGGEVEVDGERAGVVVEVAGRAVESEAVHEPEVEARRGRRDRVPPRRAARLPVADVEDLLELRCDRRQLRGIGHHE